MTMSPFMLKIIAGAGPILLLALLVVDRNHWRSKSKDQAAQIAATCQVVRTAAGNPKLDCKRVDEQIRLTGAALRDVTAASERQSSAINALASETARSKADLAAADNRAVKRVGAAEGAVARLGASARSGDRLAKPCEPSEALKGAWK